MMLERKFESNVEDLPQPQIEVEKKPLSEEALALKYDLPLVSPQEKSLSESNSESNSNMSSQVEDDPYKGWEKWTPYDRDRFQLKQFKEIDAPVMEEAREMRNKLLEENKLFSLSKEDFDTYFSPEDFETGSQLKQLNVGNCYAIAALHAMSKSPHFEMICRLSVTRKEDGSWEVRIPLMGGSYKDGPQQIITIYPKDLQAQINPHFLRKGGKGFLGLDTRWKLKALEGKEGMQVLEAAFVKLKFGKVDRFSSEGGLPGEVLKSLGGDAFNYYGSDFEWGKAGVFSENWKDWKTSTFNDFTLEESALLDHFLENFDPEIYMATAYRMAERDSNGPLYKVEGISKFFVANHAYSVVDVDSTKKIIKLANPWDTSKLITLTFDQFKETFGVLNAVSIDSRQLLMNTKKRAEEQSA